MKKFTKIFFVIFLSVLTIFGFAAPLNILSTNWYNQYFPNLNGRPISDITFVDSLLGYAVTGSQSSGHTDYILKTTNGGDNWIKLDSIAGDLTRIIFLNKDTGYVCGWQSTVSGGYLGKTTNGGINWNKVQQASFAGFFYDMFILNKDTMWVVDYGGFDGGVYRTTNGGLNWIQQYFNAGANPWKIYFVNKNLGFYCTFTGAQLFRTTNGGFNWSNLNGENGFSCIKFVDSLVGWKASSPYMKKTTNGGLNWFNQPLPNPTVGYISGGMLRFSLLNIDTIWGVGGSYQYPNLSHRGVLYRTTNKGINWLYQIPDTSIILLQGYNFIQFYDKLKGWAYLWNGTGIHTTNGGDTTFLSNIKEQITNNISTDYILYQNYPNPFNPSTNIKYQIANNKYITIKIYDINGREIVTRINKKQNSGIYNITFNGSDLSSGVYFYSLFTNGIRIDTKKMILIK